VKGDGDGFFSIVLSGAVITFYLRTRAERSVTPIDQPAPKSQVELHSRVAPACEITHKTPNVFAHRDFLDRPCRDQRCG
jgi:hypothetical protein